MTKAKLILMTSDIKTPSSVLWCSPHAYSIPKLQDTQHRDIYSHRFIYTTPKQTLPSPYTPQTHTHTHSSTGTHSQVAAMENLDTQSLHLYSLSWRCTVRPWTALRVTLDRLRWERVKRGGTNSTQHTGAHGERHTPAHSAEHTTLLHMTAQAVEGCISSNHSKQRQCPDH